MSWDVDIKIDSGGKELAIIEEVQNITWNNSSIFNFLGVHPRKFENKALCSEWIFFIENALKMLETLEFQSKLKKLEPSNGWGGIDSSKRFLQKLLAACKRHPKGIVVWQ